MFYLPAEKILGSSKSYHKRLKIDWPGRFQQLAQLAKNSLLRDYYQGGLPEADTPLEKTAFVALDIETTGLNPRENSIISIGLVPLDTKRIYAKKARHWVVKPRLGLPTESVGIHGLTHSRVEEAPDLRELIPLLLKELRGKVVISHYKDIEREFLSVALMNRTGEGLEFPIIDTMELESRLQRSVSAGFMRLLKPNKRPSMRLADCRSRYGLPRYRAHHALSDAIACAELFLAQLAYHYQPSDPLKDFWG